MPEDRDVRDPVTEAGSVPMSDEERARFQALLKLWLQDSFRLFDQPEKPIPHGTQAFYP